MEKISILITHDHTLLKKTWALILKQDPRISTLTETQPATWNNMVVVTLSEFGRTTIQNSDFGTDHAEAGVMWVAGGGINGGVYNCSTAGNHPWVPGNGGQSGSMFGENARYLKRNTDYRSVLGEIIRDHLGATQNQLNRIIPGYAAANEFLQNGGTSSDGTPIVGELGLV